MAFDFGTLKLSMDPFENFKRWMSEAENANLPEPTAMTLATASRDGTPSARIVLYKGLSDAGDGRKGFQIYTNYLSRKSNDLEQNARAALVFFWASLNRQIRVSGQVRKMSAADSDRYFASRPRGSRIGAWASPQSQKIQDRAELLKRVSEIEEKFKGNEEVPRPPNWGGWLLVPEKIEFWQAGEFRLHDRFEFVWSAGRWDVVRLAP